MTKTFVKRLVIHGTLLYARQSWIIFFPEGRGALPQHAAPIGFHLRQNRGVLSHFAERFQLVEFEVRRGDGRHLTVENHRRFDPLGHLLTGKAKDNGKEIGVPPDLLGRLSIPARGHKSPPLLIPV